MTLSTAFKRELTKRESGDPIIYLLTVTHSGLGSTQRFCTNTAGDDIVSGGNTFTAAPFELSIVAQGDGPASVQVSMANVDRAIGLALAPLSGPCTCTVQAVLLSAPNTIEREAGNLLLQDVKCGAITITGTLTRRKLHQEPIPWVSITPKNFPGLARLGA